MRILYISIVFEKRPFPGNRICCGMDTKSKCMIEKTFHGINVPFVPQRKIYFPRLGLLAPSACACACVVKGKRTAVIWLMMSESRGKVCCVACIVLCSLLGGTNRTHKHRHTRTCEDRKKSMFVCIIQRKYFQL